MAWWAPKTWTFEEILSYADMNKYLRDNLIYLYSGVQRVVSQTVRRQTDAITVTTGSTNLIDSGGLTSVAVGEVLSGDILSINAGAAIAATGGGTLGVALYDGTTLIAQFTGSNVDSSGLTALTAMDYSFSTGYSSVIVYMTINPAATGSLPAPSGTNMKGWMSVTHKRPPTS